MSKKMRFEEYARRKKIDITNLSYHQAVLMALNVGTEVPDSNLFLKEEVKINTVEEVVEINLREQASIEKEEVVTEMIELVNVVENDINLLRSKKKRV